MISTNGRGLTRAMALLTAILALASCAASRSQVAVGVDTGGPRFILDLAPGGHYRTTTGWFIFKYPVYPQVAVWVESPEGRYLGTIHVTGKVAKGSWMAAPSSGRPEALPVWSHLRQGELDSVSAATQAGETLSVSGLASSLPAGDYVIKLETNRSYDYNETFTAANSGVCGQPSIVYRASLSLGQGRVQAAFEPLGRGSLDGSDGKIQEGLAGIDTALDLFSRMSISYAE
jgi:hypothetical protein